MKIFRRVLAVFLLIASVVLMFVNAGFGGGEEGRYERSWFDFLAMAASFPMFLLTGYLGVWLWEGKQP